MKIIFVSKSREIAAEFPAPPRIGEMVILRNRKGEEELSGTVLSVRWDHAEHWAGPTAEVVVS